MMSLYVKLCILFGMVTVINGQWGIIGSYGGYCISQCEYYTGSIVRKPYNFCYTTKGGWDFCSPVPETGAYNNTCRADHRCGRHGNSYTWCYTDNNNNWDYCSFHFTAQSLRIQTAYGNECADSCENRGYSYKFCNKVGSGWDYCSTTSQVGAYGYRCRSDHRCARHGYGYTWCKTDNNNWDYCSIFYRDFTNKMSRYFYQCVSPCSNGRCSVWLHDNEYCSSQPYRTYNNIPCRGKGAEGYCGRNGYNRQYYWCRTSSSWDYCSPIENCGFYPAYSYSQPLLNANTDKNEICRIDDLGNRLRTTLSRDPDSRNRLVPPRSRQEEIEASYCISHLRFDSIDGSSRSRTLCREGSVRIDLQGIVRRNGRRFANMQVQANSLSLAGFLMPVDRWFPPRYIRRSMVESLRRTIFVVLDRMPLSPRRDVEDGQQIEEMSLFHVLFHLNKTEEQISFP